MSDKFGDVVWSWKSRDSDIQKGTMRILKNPTVADLIDHLDHVAPGVPWGDIRVSGGVVWEREADAETKAERVAWRAKTGVRAEEWERATYLRLKAKFEGEDAA